MDTNTMFKRTKIICTLGPSVDDEDTLRALMESGMDIARLNFSHGSHEEHKVRIDRLKRVRESIDSPCAIMLDTMGPEIRTGLLAGGEAVELIEGQPFTLTLDKVEGDANRVSQTSPELLEIVEPGMLILLDDGLIELEVQSIDGNDIVCTVLNPGHLGQRKSVNVPGVSIPIEPVTEKDVSDLLFGIEEDIDFVAVSFVKEASTIHRIRRILRDNGGDTISIIAKIENADAVEHIEEIIEASDGIMVARGDLGVEMPPHEVPYLQKRIIHACNCAHKPVITATQMLESMTVNRRPTRAEAADVANAIYDGTDCVMLSGETAVGAYPVEVVRTMVKIIENTESHYFERTKNHGYPTNGPKSVSHAVGTAAVQTAEDIQAKCLVCPTMTGRTARLMASLRAPIPIYSVTPNAHTMRTMQIFWGVKPFRGDVQGSMRRVIQNAQDVVVAHGYLEEGDVAVFTCGDRFTSPIKRDEQGIAEKFAPANVMYVVQIRDEKSALVLEESGEDALMTHAFFDKEKLDRVSLER